MSVLLGGRKGFGGSCTQIFWISGPCFASLTLHIDSERYLRTDAPAQSCRTQHTCLRAGVVSDVSVRTRKRTRARTMTCPRSPSVCGKARTVYI